MFELGTCSEEMADWVGLFSIHPAGKAGNPAPPMENHFIL
jgi:hypothetical protein